MEIIGAKICWYDNNGSLTKTNLERGARGKDLKTCLAGLCAVGFVDDHYLARTAFSVLDQTWKSAKEDSAQPWPYLDNALTKFQDPVEADKLLKIKRELDETNIILHKTIYSVLARGEKLNSLVEKTSMMVFISMAPPSQFLLLRMEKPQRRLIMDSSLEVVGESRTYDFTL
ncbi:hypothetical protein YC2023_067868 [Brassica napus]